MTPHTPLSPILLSQKRKRGGRQQRWKGGGGNGGGGGCGSGNGGGGVSVCVCGESVPFHMHGGEERQGSAGSGLPVLSCERQTFGRVITRHTALGVISDSCLFEAFGAHNLYGPRLPPLHLMFRLHLHEEEGCTCQYSQ